MCEGGKAANSSFFSTLAYSNESVPTVHFSGVFSFFCIFLFFFQKKGKKGEKKGGGAEMGDLHGPYYVLL